jgi:uncharacterized protein (TIGR02452 family)
MRLKEIALQNEKYAQDNPYKTSVTVPLSVSSLLDQKHMTIAKEGKIDFRLCTTEQAIWDAHTRNPSATICVLNFADRKIPGGRYLQGATTQEESLCRVMPGLFRSLSSSGSYPYESYQTLLWTAGTWLQRISCHNFNWLLSPIKVAVVSAAAPNRTAGEKFSPELFAKLVEAIVLCPFLHGPVDVLILGAFGTGAFRNDVMEVAHAFALAVQKHAHLYSHIVFAIPDSSKLDRFAKQFSITCSSQLESNRNLPSKREHISQFESDTCLCRH